MYRLTLEEEYILYTVAFLAVEVYVRFRLGVEVEVFVENMDRPDLVHLLEGIEGIVYGGERYGRIPPLELLVHHGSGWMARIAEHILDHCEPLRGQLIAPTA